MVCLCIERYPYTIFQIPAEEHMRIFAEKKQSKIPAKVKNVFILPYYRMSTLRFHLNGNLFEDDSDIQDCAGNDMCFRYEGIEYQSG